MGDKLELCCNKEHPKFCRSCMSFLLLCFCSEHCQPHCVIGLDSAAQFFLKLATYLCLSKLEERHVGVVCEERYDIVCTGLPTATLLNGCQDPHNAL